MICCAFFKDNQCVEPYLKHIYVAGLIWSRIYKKYYLKSVQRVLNSKNDNDLVLLAILYHDLGKLTTQYMKGDRKSFRHELVGAYLAYKTHKNNIGLYLALAVMLHHESGILGIYAGEKGEDFITLSTLKKVIYGANLEVYCDLTTDDPWYNKAKGIFRNEIDYINRELKNIDKREMYEIIKEIVIRSTVGESNKLLEIRTKAATLLYPLTLVDSISASFTRKEYSDNDSSTWVTNRALGIEGTRAEIPSKEELEDLLRKEGIIQ